MKKYIYLILSLFLIPIMVNAETLTYNVCESGCEYTSLNDVNTAINNLTDISDKDIVINVNSDMSRYLYIGNIDNVANSVTINGNNHDFNGSSFVFFSKQVEINDCNNIQSITLYNSDKININNSNIIAIQYFAVDSNNQIKSEEINLSEIFDIDETSKNNLKALLLAGNFKIENMNFGDIVLIPAAGTIKIYNSQIGKILDYPMLGNITTNVYNSKFNSLKYVNITSSEDTTINEFNQFLSSLDSSLLNYDIYDIDSINMGGQTKSTTTINFDKEANLKLSDKLNLVEYLDYYTEDKEIEYTIEDESIAKIDNKELIGLKEGSTKVTVTTDDGHVVYNINLVVEKETIPEKIDSMTIKVPITGSKVKAWVVLVSALLLVIIGVCSYMLIRRKK